MKKKVVAMFLAAVMALSLVACGSKSDNGGSGDASGTETIKLGGVGPPDRRLCQLWSVRTARRGAGCQGDQRCRRRQR